MYQKAISAPHYENEALCKVVIMKIRFHSYANKSNFHMKSFALSFAFVIRFKATRKWSIEARVHNIGATCTFCNVFYGWSREHKNEQQNNVPSRKKINGAAGYQGPVKIELLKGVDLLTIFVHTQNKNQTHRGRLL